MSFIYKTDTDGRERDVAGARIAIVGVAFLIGVIIFWTIVGPIYNVWSSGKAGEAELAQAEYKRQIIVRQAQAKKDAASLEADAAVAHAKGVKESNEIIANGLGGPEGYLRFLYIQMLQDSDNKQVIYIPTEAGLPILEAGKR